MPDLELRLRIYLRDTMQVEREYFGILEEMYRHGVLALRLAARCSLEGCESHERQRICSEQNVFFCDIQTIQRENRRYRSPSKAEILRAVQARSHLAYEGKFTVMIEAAEARDRERDMQAGKTAYLAEKAAQSQRSAMQKVTILQRQQAADRLARARQALEHSESRGRHEIGHDEGIGRDDFRSGAQVGQREACEASGQRHRGGVEMNVRSNSLSNASNSLSMRGKKKKT